MNNVMKHLVALSWLLAVPSIAVADWTQFRGDQGRSAASGLIPVPDAWNDVKVAWRVGLPGKGPASPIVVNDRVFVTCASGYDQDRIHVICFEASTGQKIWHRQFWATGRTRSHPTSGNAAPTPASDGDAIYAFYSSNDLICLDLDGNLRWMRGLAYDFPKIGNDIGMSSSPVVSDQTVVAQVENQGESFVFAIDTTDGRTRWQIDRPRIANWSSPVIAQTLRGESVVLLKSSEGLDAHVLQTGQRRWTVSSSAGGIASIATRPGQIFLPSDGVTALQMSSDGTSPEVLWTSQRVKPNNASPVVSDDRIYGINSAGVLSCADLADGSLQWQLRLKGSFWSTPVLLGHYLFCVNDVGLAQVVMLGDQGKVVAAKDLGEGVLGSPAVAAGGLFLRSNESLWKVSIAP